MSKVKLRAIEIYKPGREVDNSFFTEQFDKLGQDIRPFLQMMGKEKRYIADPLKETTISIGIEASKKVLASAGLTGEDIDMIVFSSQFPEFTVPPQSLFVHQAIGGKEDTFCTDTNTDCVGTIVAIDMVSRYLLSHDRYKRALIVGADLGSVHFKKDDVNSYPTCGDLACAIILEKTEEACGFIDTQFKTNSKYPDIIAFPACGASKSYDSSIDERKMRYNSFDGRFIVKHMKESVEKLLKRNGLSIKDVDIFCFTQFAYPIITGSAEILGVDLDRFIYVGDKYGYTGTSSPMVALHDAIKDGRIKKGDRVMFWSIGGNWVTCALLIQY